MSRSLPLHWMLVLLLMLGFVRPSPAQAADAAPVSTLYGAIDVGSRGVKASLYAFQKEGEGVDARPQFKAEINTTLVSGAQDKRFTEAGIAEATRAVVKLLGDMRAQAAKLKRTDVTYYIVGSSGVARFDNRDELKTAVEAATGLAMNFIDASQEAYYAALSAVPRNRRAVGAAIDIGSGNTKLGCVVDGQAEWREIPYGSVSLRKEAVSRAASDADYVAAVDGIIRKDVQPAISGCVTTRSRLYWIGGAAWATATSIHPEAASWGFVPITPADVDDFLKRLKDGSWNQGEPKPKFAASVSAGQRAEILKAAVAERQSVMNVFSREDLIAGVSLMKAILQARAEPASLFFVRNGNYIYGWALEKFKADADEPAAAALADATYLAGIDLGSRGVKAFVYSFAHEGEALDARVLFKATINTKLTSSAEANRFTTAGIEEARLAVVKLVEQMREFAKQKGIEPRFYLVASSGVAAYENRAELKNAVDAATGLELEFVDARTEAMDALLSAVPVTRRQESVLVDVGSGNTKLGCLTGETFNADEIPYGTTKLRTSVAAEADYETGLQALLANVAKSYRSVRMNTPCFGNRTRFYFVGGAPWSISTFARPEMVRVGYVPLTRPDVAGFLARLRDGSWNQQEPVLSFAPKATAEYREAIRKESAAARADVQNVFSREDLLAGASLVQLILENGNPSATVYFVRNGNYLFGFALNKFKDIRAAEESPAPR